MSKCIVCGSDSVIIRKRQNLEDLAILDICKCFNCGLEFFSPMLTEKELSSYFSNYYDIRAKDEVVEKNARRNMEALEKYGLTKEHTLLDFGCGKNTFVKLGISSLWKGYDKYAPVDRYMVPYFNYQSWDFITMWGVLAHLPNPVETLRSLSKCMEIGGKLAFTEISLEAEIPCRYRYEHITYWTRLAIENLFRLVGLKIIEYRPYKMIQDIEVYMSIILRTVPESFRNKIQYDTAPKYVEIPTNEMFVIGIKEK